MTQTYAPNKANYSYGRGRVLLNVHTAADALTYWAHMGNVSKFELTPSEVHATLRASYEASSGVIADAMIQRDWDLGMTCEEWNFENLRTAFAGAIAYYTQSNTPITAEVLTTSATLGGRYFAAKRQGTSITVKQTGSAIVLGTDYQIIDANAMEIYLLPTSVTVTAGTTITIDYTPTTIASTAQPYITAGSRGTINASIKYMGDSPAAGPGMEVHVFSAVLQAKDVMSFIQSQGATSFSSFGMSGKVLSDTAGSFGGTSTDPFFRVWQR